MLWHNPSLQAYANDYITRKSTSVLGIERQILTEFQFYKTLYMILFLI